MKFLALGLLTAGLLFSTQTVAFDNNRTGSALSHGGYVGQPGPYIGYSDTFDGRNTSEHRGHTLSRWGVDQANPDASDDDSTEHKHDHTHEYDDQATDEIN